jgi:hypothetical protein
MCQKCRKVEGVMTEMAVTSNPPKTEERKLSAIPAADEVRTVDHLTERRRIMDRLVFGQGTAE